MSTAERAGPRDSQAGGVIARHRAAAPVVDRRRVPVVLSPPPDLPADDVSATSGSTRHFSIVIGRQLGTVVVAVHGEVDMSRAGRLAHILADLIDGQGNLSLVVDLHDATTSDPDSLSVFVEAAERARQRGGSVTLAEPPVHLGEALQLRGLDRFVGVEPDVRTSRDGGT